MRPLQRLKSSAFGAGDVLPACAQILLGIGVIVISAISLLISGSLIVSAGLLGLALAWYLIRNPTYSLYLCIAINIAITLRPKSDAVGVGAGAPSTLDALLGLLLLATYGYWLMRIRLFENQDLSTSKGQLAIALFFVWSLIVFIGGVIIEGNPFAVGVREILNLLPLLLIPMLYERFVEPDSKGESVLFAVVLVTGVLMVTANIIVFRSNVARAFYLFQTGRSVLDLALTSLMIVVMASLFMTKQRWWAAVLTVGVFLYSLVGLAISFTRAVYVSVFLAICLMLFLGSWEERKRGVRALSYAALTGIVAMIPIAYSSRVFRLLLASYFSRILSTQHVSSDLSLRMRYAEWNSEWNYIAHSPLFGYGNGARFRIYEILHHYHIWMDFSHNSYLYLMFKTGFVGFGLFMTATAAILYKGFQLTHHPSLSNRSRMVIRAVVAFIFLTLVGAYGGPTFDSKIPITWLALAWGYILALDRKVKHFDREQLDVATAHVSAE